MRRIKRVQRMPRIFVACFGAIACTSGALAQEEFCGAEGIIQQICVELPDEAAQAAKPELPIEALREEARTFAEMAADLPPEAAAAGWLALVSRFNELLDQPGSGVTTRGYSYGSQPTAFDLVIGALPPPPAWPALAEAVRQRELGEGGAAHREHCLRILVALLLGEDGPQFESLAAIKRLFTATTDDEYHVRENARELQRLADALAEFSDDPSHALEAFETLITLAAQDPNDDMMLRMMGIEVPNLVTLAGEAEAERLLRRAVVLPVLLNLTGDAATRALAQRVALEQVGEMAAPQWLLCFEMPDTALYDALRERFVTKRAEARRADPDRFLDQQSRLAGQLDDHEIQRAEQGARWHYLARLILDERYDDARPVALGLEESETGLYHMYGRYDRDYTAAGLIRRSPQAGRAFEFFAELLREDPALPFWQLLIDLGGQLGRQEEVLAAMEGVGPEDVGEQEYRFRNERRRLLLTSGRVDTLIAELRAAKSRSARTERRSPHGQRRISPNWGETSPARSSSMRPPPACANCIMRERTTRRAMPLPESR